MKYVKRNLDENVPIHPDLRKSALHVQRKIEWEDAGPQMAMAMGTEMGGGAVASHHRSTSTQKKIKCQIKTYILNVTRSLFRIYATIYNLLIRI